MAPLRTLLAHSPVFQAKQPALIELAA